MAKKTKKKAKNKKNGKTQGATEKPFGYVFGRPTKYRPEYCDLTKYLAHCEKKNYLPSKCGLSAYLGVDEDTLTSWGKKYPDFLGALKIVMVIEKRTLTDKGLLGLYNSTIAKLILSANHGLMERLDTTTGGEKIQQEQLTIEQIKERIAAVEAVGLDGMDVRSINGGGGK